MIDLKGIISIPLLKKTSFCGSDGILRYRLSKQTIDDVDKLIATYWLGEYCWQATPDENKISKSFEFTTEGIYDAADWLNSIVRKL